jgi:propionyl-CoA synthetase
MVEPLRSKDSYIYYPNRSCDDFSNPHAEAIFKESIADPAAFWAKKAELIHWHKKPETILDTTDQYLHRWFKDGEVNMSYNCLDIHVKEGRGDNVCFIEDSAYTGHKRRWTYAEIHNRVGRLASVYKKHYKLETGDRVLIYMPMVIEAAVAMLACARIGAITSVVFGGFASRELASRIDDCSPKLIVCSSCGIEPGKHIKYVPIVEEALGFCKIEDAKKI